MEHNLWLRLGREAISKSAKNLDKVKGSERISWQQIWARSILFFFIYFTGNHMQKNNNKMDEDLKKMLASVDIHDLKYITVNDFKWVISMDSWPYLFMCLSHTGWFQHNLGEFYNRTRPTYQFAYCRLEFLDCLRMWTIVKSTIGIDLFWFQSDLYFQSDL